MQAGAPTDTTSAVTRGELAQRAYQLLAIGPVNQARASQAYGALRAAFGGELGMRTLSGPWLAARSLARGRETLDAQPAIGWLLRR